jgi:hypothetical protein
MLKLMLFIVHSDNASCLNHSCIDFDSPYGRFFSVIHKANIHANAKARPETMLLSHCVHHALNDHALNDHTLNGHALNDHVLNYHALDDLALKGHALNVHTLNDHALNDHALKGHELNDHALNETACKICLFKCGGALLNCKFWVLTAAMQLFLQNRKVRKAKLLH